MKLIENIHTKLLAKALDVYALRNKMNAANIANIGVEGYKRAEITFENTLQDKMQFGLNKTSDVDKIQPVLVQTEDPVELEEELMEMADTQMRVQLAIRALRQNYDQMRMGISGRTS